MPEVLTPVIPQDITVHLGAPGSNAQNVTVNFVATAVTSNTYYWFYYTIKKV